MAVTVFPAAAVLRQHRRRRSVREKGKETTMYQVRENVVRPHRAAAVAVLFGLVAWLGLLIGAEAVQRHAAWHLADASVGLAPE
jgi:hypothetical protein